MSNLEKAFSWFNSRGINAKFFDDSLLVEVQEYEVLIANEEIEYRAELWDEENLESEMLNS